MKDSGVEWIGDVPEHWEIQRLKNLSQIKTGGKDTINSVEDGEYPFFVRSQTIERINSYSFDGEAILTAGDGVGVGKVFHYVNEKFDYHQRVYKISHFRGLDGKFLFYYMRNHFYKEAFRLNAKATVDSLRMPMFQNFPVVFGSKEEQKAIADYLDKKTAQIDQIIQTINTQIEKLKELRKTLINDVVTGKIRV
jgi:type I restriction enzyme S subunit